VVCRSCWILALAFCLSGCFTFSKAARDSDEDEWGARWGGDDVDADKGKDEARVAAVKDDRRDTEPGQEPPAQKSTAAFESPPPPTQAKPAMPRPRDEVPKNTPQKKPQKKPEKPQKTAQAEAQTAPPSVEEPPAPEPTEPVEPPVVLYPGEEEKKPAGKKSNESQPAHAEKKTAQTRPVVVSTAGEDPLAGEPWVFIDAAGGIYLTQKGRIHPGVALSLGINLGKTLGWKGLYVAVDNDIIIAEHQLGTSEYIILDTQLGFKGRFLLGPVRLLAGLGFALRNAFVTSYTDEKPAASLGLGVVFAAGLEVPIWGPIGAMIRGDGRYVKDPFRERFVFSSMIVGGVNFTF